LAAAGQEPGVGSQGDDDTDQSDATPTDLRRRLVHPARGPPGGGGQSHRYRIGRGEGDDLTCPPRPTAELATERTGEGPEGDRRSHGPLTPARPIWPVPAGGRPRSARPTQRCHSSW